MEDIKHKNKSGNFPYPLFFETEIVGIPGGISLRTMLDVKEVLFNDKSEYQTIGLFHTDNFGRVLVLDGVFQTSEEDEFIYHEALVHISLINHPNPVRVLIIGGGDGGAAEEVLKHPMVEECVLVEIDSKVVDVCKTYLEKIHKGVFDNPRLTLHIGNGIEFVIENKNPFDVVIADLTDSFGGDDPIYTEEFYRFLKNQLKPGGLVSLHMGSVTAYPYETARIYKMIIKVFKAAKPYFNYIPLYGSIMAFCLCGENEEILPLSVIKERLEARKLFNLQFLTPETYQALFAIPPYILRMLHGKW
jgi:spermidine synthase